MTKMRLFIRIFTKNESIEINPDDFDFIQDVILVRTDLKAADLKGGVSSGRISGLTPGP